jgi:hypothetical protein
MFIYTGGNVFGDLIMGLFTDWVVKKAFLEDAGPVDNFRFNKSTVDLDHPVDHDRIRNELFRLVMDKYPEETNRFLHDIAQRGDNEIQSLLAQVQVGKPPRAFNDIDHRDKDEVVPAKADGAHGDGGGGMD